MKPAPFQYRVVSTVAEATAMLAEHGDEAAILAGGQSLVPLLNLRLARPAVVVDINRVAELGSYRVTTNAIAVGATVRARLLERADDVAATLPLLRRALGFVAHPQIRTRTTIGGNVAHADPAAELPTVLVALDGEVTVSSVDGTRQIAADEFFEGPMTTTLRPDEMVTEVNFPVRPAMRWGFDEIARRHGDFAVVGTCVGVASRDGVVTDAVIALAGCGPRPIRCGSAEKAIVGRSVDGKLDEIADAVTESISPGGDIHASAEYRRVVAGRLVRRVATELMRAAA